MPATRPVAAASFSGARALLDRHERDRTAALDRLARELADAPPDAALAMLTAQVVDQIDNDLERAVRAWSISDPSARATQERLDRARLVFLSDLWARLLGDADRARAAALVPHLVAIGLSVARPRLAPDEVSAVFELLTTLAARLTTDE